MARMRRKADLTQKTCTICDRPFSWRKKWERVWDEVKYCSDACRKRSRMGSNRLDSGTRPFKV